MSRSQITVGLVGILGLGTFLLLVRSIEAPADGPPLASTRPEDSRLRQDVQGLTNLYGDRALEQWADRYAENIRWNLDNAVLRYSSDAVRSAFRRVDMEFPLRRSRGEPFGFVSYPDQQRIVMSVQSIKFIDDLAVASAWLERNGYSTNTIIDYASVLKYCPSSAFPGGRYPRPWEALGIPDGALSDGIVDDLSQKILKSAIIYILAHEVGHLYGRGTGIRAELAADSFAIDVFRNMRVIPLGMVLFFQAHTYMAPHSGDFASDGEWQRYQRNASHPLTSSRLSRIAEQLRISPRSFIHPDDGAAFTPATVNLLSGNLDTVATLLGDTDLLRWTRTRAETIPMRELLPRRPDDIWDPSGTGARRCTQNR